MTEREQGQEPAGRAAWPITELGDPLLREVATPLREEDFGSAETAALVAGMIATCRKASGAGIAAPQVGRSQRLFLIEVRDNPRYPGRAAFPLTVIANPSVHPTAEQRARGLEGCLSIPGLRGYVERFQAVHLQGRDPLTGAELHYDLEGFPAVVAQHEQDHLEGILFLDRVGGTGDLLTEGEWQRQNAAKAEDRG